MDLPASYEQDAARIFQAMLRDGVWHADRAFYPYHSIYKAEVVSVT